MNHLRKLALLSSLALSFSVKADGTLPLPVGNKLPLEMADSTLGDRLAMSIENMSTNAEAQPSIGGTVPCKAGDEFKSAVGSVTLNQQTLNVLGVCAPKTAAGSAALRRTVVTSDQGEQTFILFNGNIDDLKTMKRFSGSISVSPLAPGVGPEALPRTFDLVRIDRP